MSTNDPTEERASADSPPDAPDAPEAPDAPDASSFLLSVAVMILVLIAAELAFRAGPLEPKIRKANYITAKAAELKAVPAAEIVSTGDSRMFHGVVPSTMTEALKEQTGEYYRTFNFGVPSATSPIWLLVAHEAARKVPRPKVFLVGVTPAGFSCCDTISAVGTAPAVRPYAAWSIVKSMWRDNPEEAGAAVLLAGSRLLGERTEVIAAYREVTSPNPLSFADMGWVSMGSAVSAQTQDTRARGRAPGYADLMDKKKGAYVHPIPPKLLRELLAVLKGAGIKPIVIETPQARQLDWYHDREHTYFEFLETVKGVSAEMGVPFHNLNDFPGLENGDFIDGDHLCEAGAKKFTRYLAKEVIAPVLSGR